MSADIIEADPIEASTVTLEGEQVVTPRQQFLYELRGILDLLESNPDLPLPQDVGASAWSRLSWYPANAREAATLMKALGGRWQKNDPHKSEFDATYLHMTSQLGRELHVDVLVSREGVCEKKVVGTERRKVEKVTKTEVYEDVPVVEFECKSLMSLADQKIMDELEAVAS